MLILCTIGGFQGQPVTLAGSYEDGLLIVAKQLKYREDKPSPEFAMVSNLDLPDIDYRFTDAHFADAIRAYYAWRAQQNLDLVDALSRYSPDNRIESDRVDETGRKYRINPDIDNGQIAVLAMVSYAQRQSGIGSAVDMAKEFADFAIYTI